MVPEGGQYLAAGATLEPGLFRPQTQTLFLNSYFILIGHIRGGLQVVFSFQVVLQKFCLYFSFPHSCYMSSPITFP